MIVTDGLMQAAARAPERPAIVIGGSAVTYGEVARRIEDLVPRLSGLDRVAILLLNDPDLLIVFLAAVRAGATAMVLDPTWPHALRRQILAAHPARRLITVPTQILDDAAPVSRPHEQTQFLMGFTSGTTGVPKAFVRTHASWLATFAAARKEFGDIAAKNVLAPGSLCHSLTLYATVETLEAGGTIHLLPAFDAKSCVSLLRHGAVQSLHCVPSMLELICDAARSSPPISSAFDIVCAGAKLSTALRARLKITFPSTRVFEYYGASELSFVTLSTPRESPPPESVGRPFHGVRLAVRRDDGGEAAAGEVGTVWLQSALVCEGYVGESDGSGFRRAGDWVTVGDRGALDGQGYLTLAGRENEMLNSGGLNVYPQEVEAVLAQCPGVRGVTVIGLPDPRWGDVIAAVIEGDAGRDELLATCADVLPRAKWPRRWFTAEALPRTTSGKVSRATVIAMLPGLRELI